MSSRTRNSGAALKERLAKGLLIAPGIHDGVSARQAVQAGAEAVYMTGFGVAGSLLGVPDIGLVSATEMAERVRALAAAALPVPLIADGDNGHGGTANVERLVRAYEHAGAAAIQLEDQVLPKRCGHLDGKEIVSREEAVAKIRAAVGARDAGTFLVIARTDARSVRGMDEALWRADAFLSAGADVLFVEAPQSHEELRLVADRFPGIPLMANMVEDGKTPMLPPAELAALGYRLVIYPVSALLAAAHAVEAVYRKLLQGQEVPRTDRVTFQHYNEIMDLKSYLGRD
ncbi:MAG: isocitrate lyase/phosphoenolpyruvate mutase family protein [Alphaproteobacteria bacterium]|nr:isocitrate lyase/phosphoenolpyruvate mutase family protein [Alphaproteobacteria bacterium]